MHTRRGGVDQRAEGEDPQLGEDAVGLHAGVVGRAPRRLCRNFGFDTHAPWWKGGPCRTAR